MYVVSVTIWVKSECVSHFIEASLDNARNSRLEPGNLRWDFAQVEGEPTRFLVYEVYRRKEDFAAHQQTAHYFRWRDAVANDMAQARQGVRHQAIFFGDAELEPGK